MLGVFGLLVGSACVMRQCDRLCLAAACTATRRRQIPPGKLKSPWAQAVCTGHFHRDNLITRNIRVGARHADARADQCIGRGNKNHS